jgi:16S rRNA (guanine966-N2)-methyltransferase
VRIVAGRFRGRPLYGPSGHGLRPTADHMKESIYNVLQGWFPGARVLDLYAGTGNLGLEALSRGAARVVLVENARAALRLIARNLEALGARDEVEVVSGDALRYLRHSRRQRFDVVLADPPYEAGVEEELMAALPEAAPPFGSCFVLQHRRTWQLDAVPSTFSLWRSKRFGDTVVDFLLREEEA